MSDDTSQVSLIAGYQPDEAGITAQVTGLAGYQPAEVGLASQLATLVGYRYPVASTSTRPNVFMWSSAASVVDSYFFSGSYVSGEEEQ